MDPYNASEERARQVLAESGSSLSGGWVIDVLRSAGLRVADEQRDELVCRWVNVLERPVPPEADTIIRTITRTVNGQSSSTTHWLEGLRSPHER
jgi:hypothetical protein